MYVAFEIPRPWPKVRRLDADRVARQRADGRRWLHIRRSSFWYVGSFELYWNPAITVWRRDRRKTSGPAWKVTCPLLRDWRRHLLTRCEWCGGPSRKRDYVNVTGGSNSAGRNSRGERIRPPWWRGERGLYHGDCSSIAHAHTICLCGPEGGPWEHELADYPYGRCATCGKYRGWRSLEERTSETYPGLHANRLLASIPPGERDPKILAIVRGMWAHHRKETA